MNLKTRNTKDMLIAILVIIGCYEVITFAFSFVFSFFFSFLYGSLPYELINFVSTVLNYAIAMGAFFAGAFVYFKLIAKSNMNMVKTVIVAVVGQIVKAIIISVPRTIVFGLFGYEIYYSTILSFMINGFMFVLNLILSAIVAFLIYYVNTTKVNNIPYQTAGGAGFCTACGNPLVSGNRFCTKCGKAL